MNLYAGWVSAAELNDLYEASGTINLKKFIPRAVKYTAFKNEAAKDVVNHIRNLIAKNKDRIKTDRTLIVVSEYGYVNYEWKKRK